MPELADSPSLDRQFEDELHQACASCYADPLKFVRVMYRWPIKGEPGPDTWQTEVLTWIGQQVRDRRYNGVDSVPPIRLALATGHGIGKTSLFAWLVDWLLSTRPHCRGTVTANTADQLQLKTWAAVQEWTARCLTGHWFEINSAIMYRRGHRATWACAPVSCAPENADAYQGQHAKGSTSFYLFDEASGIAQSIWDAAEGGLTDEPLFLVAGQPTSNVGPFYTACFGDGRDRWHARVIDARDCKFSPKDLIAEWIASTGGEDSDFVRVHVRGLAPRASSLQFIDQERIWGAQRRPDVVPLAGEPLVAGVDVSGGGSAWNVVRFRRGLDARSIPPIRIPGEATRQDRGPFLAVLASLLRDQRPTVRLSAMFVDAAYGAPYVERLHAMGFWQVQEVSFGSPSPNVHQGNMRAYMWAQMKEWLPYGTVGKEDRRLEQDLIAPGYHHSLNRAGDQLMLESKESMQRRGIASPDDADALALTWAAPVALAQPDADLGPTVRGRHWQST